MEAFCTILIESLQSFVDIQNELIEIFEEPNESEKEKKVDLFILKYEESKFLMKSSNIYLFLQYIGNIINFHYEKISFIETISEIIHRFSNKIRALINQYQLVKIAIKSKLLLIILIEQQIIDKKFLIKNLVHDYSNSKLNTNFFDYLTPEFDEYKDSHKIQLQDELVNEYYKFGPFKKIKNKENYDDDDDEEEEDGYEEYYDADGNKVSAYRVLNIEPDLYIKYRKCGENQWILCFPIRNDDIDEFVTLLEKTQAGINKIIPSYLYDSNQYPSKNDNKVSLIEYSVYKGSLIIFRHLLLRNAKYSEQIWFYAIHGGNNDIIHDIEEKLKIQCDYKKAFKYAIQCHQNQIAEYIYQSYLDENSLTDGVFECISSYNFSYLVDLLDTIKAEIINLNIDNFFNKFIEFCYCDIIEKIMESKNFDFKIKQDLMFELINANDSLMISTLLKYLESSSDYLTLIQTAIDNDSPDSLKVLFNQCSDQKKVKDSFLSISFFY